MTAYAVAHLPATDAEPAVTRRLHELGATLAPFGGRLVDHGESVVVIRFPSRERATAWYASGAYQAIAPGR